MTTRVSSCSFFLLPSLFVPKKVLEYFYHRDESPAQRFLVVRSSHIFSIVVYLSHSQRRKKRTEVSLSFSLSLRGNDRSSFSQRFTRDRLALSVSNCSFFLLSFFILCIPLVHSKANLMEHFLLSSLFIYFFVSHFFHERFPFLCVVQRQSSSLQSRGLEGSDKFPRTLSRSRGGTLGRLFGNQANKSHRDFDF